MGVQSNGGRESCHRDASHAHLTGQEVHMLDPVNAGGGSATVPPQPPGHLEPRTRPSCPRPAVRASAVEFVPESDLYQRFTNVERPDWPDCGSAHSHRLPSVALKPDQFD